LIGTLTASTECCFSALERVWIVSPSSGVLRQAYYILALILTFLAIIFKFIFFFFHDSLYITCLFIQMKMMFSLGIHGITIKEFISKFILEWTKPIIIWLLIFWRILFFDSFFVFILMILLLIDHHMIFLLIMSLKSSMFMKLSVFWREWSYCKLS
jgi:hypothetical protein